MKLTLVQTNKFFSGIKDEWDNIDKSSNVDIITLDKDIQAREEFYMELLSRRNKRNEMAIRDDYHELAECAMILLEETPPSGKITCNKASFCTFGN